MKRKVAKICTDVYVAPQHECEDIFRHYGEVRCVVCPECGAKMYAPSSIISSNAKFWTDGYYHFLCDECRAHLKVK